MPEDKRQNSKLQLQMWIEIRKQLLSFGSPKVQGASGE